MSPAAFERCVAENGRIRTIKLGATKYKHVCWKNGKSYQGEVKVKKSHTEPLKRRIMAK
jgi:hypothetical protein